MGLNTGGSSSLNKGRSISIRLLKLTLTAFPTPALELVPGVGIWHSSSPVRLFFRKAHLETMTATQEKQLPVVGFNSLDLSYKLAELWISGGNRAACSQEAFRYEAAALLVDTHRQL